jgi:hypothetical protein
MADYQRRFAIGTIALVADRGLISEENLDDVATAGFDHVLATRLHRDADVEAVLRLADEADRSDWVAVTPTSSFALELTHDNKRYVVVTSD